MPLGIVAWDGNKLGVEKKYEGCLNAPTLDRIPVQPLTDFGPMTF